MSRRTERLASTIRQELALIIMRELNDPRITGMPSITRVKVSADLSTADVYFTIMGSDAEQNTTLNALRRSAGMMRAKLSQGLSLRITPYLKLHLDESLKREMAVLDLLAKIRAEDAERNPPPAADPDETDAERGETGKNAETTTEDRPTEDQPDEE